MTQSKFENLSALMDGEPVDKSLLKAMGEDAECQSKWRQYHLVRDCLRDEVPKEIQLDLSDSIAKALEKEPTVLAPFGWKRHVARVTPVLRQGGQFAVAASVAVAMILGYQQFNQGPVDPAINTAPTLGVSGINAGLAPVSLEQTRSLEQPDAAEQRRKINALLADHQQQVLLKTTSAEKTEETEDNAEQNNQ